MEEFLFDVQFVRLGNNTFGGYCLREDTGKMVHSKTEDSISEDSI